MQKYIGIFPSKFNYNKKLPLISIIVPLSFCENKVLDFFFLLGVGYFCTII
jgi:hypothetical protein